MRHFLTLADLTPAELQEILNLAVQLKTEWKAGGNPPLLGGKVLGMIFQKPSLRTRVSFDMAMLHLGGHALYLSPNEIQLGKRESTADVARVLARYVHVIMARVFDHADVVELAKWATVPVINGLSDYSHPCQGVADFLTILEHKGTLKGRKLAYLGDSNNVTHSLIFGATKLGMDFALGAPEGYSLRPDVLALAQQFAAESGSKISISTDPRAAIQDADVVYTDTWTSMGQEAEAEERRKVFPPYQVNTALLAYARPDAIVMHCLPAHRGDEITDEVADGPQSVIFDQAENRMHAQKAILIWVLE
ncbi:MAG TPA: ornithine carbamoyltransferase [Anaerolineae bacterium]|nr:ornithine carbamoyltransferase [Anaerolineae bacterium]HRT31717.1 ornithine carbamoyltransferase [Anaerolineae bacterium]HRU93677.1 ornithine carbamoyltransferase [Anaerolineae bacterium]HXK42814.1 ornithine carbamoyltransferase [Anaerolineae bacterium]